MGDTSVTPDVMLAVSQFSRNVSKRNAVSIGPPAASGWNCTEKIFFETWMMPSLDMSLAFMNMVFQPAGREFESTAYPWFCAVM